MPYELKKVNEAKSLYKVCKSDDKNKCFSKKPLRKFVAVKQKKAIELNERRRKTGGARRVPRYTPTQWNNLYSDYKDLANNLGVDDPYDLDSFKSLFKVDYTNHNDDSYETLRRLAQMNYDAENQSDEESSEDENVTSLTDEEIKARKEEADRQKNKITEDFKKRRSELAKRFYYGGLSMPINYILNPFFEKNLPPTAVVGFNTNVDIKNEIYITEAELDDPKQADPGLNKRQLLGETDIITGKSDDCLKGLPNINIDILQNTYDYLIEISKNTNHFTKQRMGFFVDATHVQQDNDVPNEDIIIGITSILQHVGNTENLCVDKCEPDGTPYGFHVMGGQRQYGISLFVDVNKNIIFTSGADIELRSRDTDLHINYLCGSTYTYTIFDAYKRMAETGKDYFWDGSPFDRLSLMSVADYNTVQFYYKQGMKNEKKKDSYRDKFQRFIKDKFGSDYSTNDYEGKLKFIKELIQVFERPICKKTTETVEVSYVKNGKRMKKMKTMTLPNSKILNDVYQDSGCGGDKYYELTKDKNGKAVADIADTDNLFDFNMLFKEECEFIIGDLEEKIEEAKEKEAYEEVKRRGRTAMTAFSRNIKAAKFNIGRTVQEMARQGKLNYKSPPSTKESIFPPSTQYNFKFEKPPVDRSLARKQINMAKLNNAELRNELRTDIAHQGLEDQEEDFLQPSTNLRSSQKAVFKPPIVRSRSDYRNKPDLRDKILKAFNINDRRRENFEESGLSNIQTGSGIKGVKFDEELRRYGINPTDYLNQMKKWAKASGYDEKQLTLDNNDKNKLRIMTEQGTKHFGRVGYKDYYIYRHLEKEKKVKKGYAKIMRDRFRKSHGAISKKRKLGRNSANELSLRILWHEDDDEKNKKKKEKA